MMALVVFHMHGCPHCKAVTGPESAAKGVADLVPVYEIESSDPLSKKVGVASFPTIMLVTPHVVFQFEGVRKPKELRRFVLEKMGQCFMLNKLLQQQGQ